jgi:riboflavin transporter FmnP
MKNVSSNKSSWSKNKTQYLVKVSLLSAIAFVLLLLEIPYPLSDHLKLDFSDIVGIIGGIALGPVAAIIIIITKSLLKAIFFSLSGGVGEIVLILVGLAYTMPIVLLYKKVKSNKGMILIMVLGVVSMTVIAGLTNFYISIPLYAKLFYSMTFTSSEKIALIMTVYTPFNLIKGSIISVLSFSLLKYVPKLVNTVRIKD